MSDMYVALLAASRLEDAIQDFLDARLSGQRDLVVAGNGVKLSAFRGNGLIQERKNS